MADGKNQSTDRKPVDPLFVPFKDLVSNVQPTQYLIHQILERGAVAVIFGESGAYKTFVVLDLLMHVASGKSWHGKQVEKGGVFYICGEGHNGLKRRARAWQINHQVDDVPFWASRKAIWLDSPDAFKEAKDQINEVVGSQTVLPAIIAIDTLSRNMLGDESSAVDMNKFVDAVSEFVREEFSGCSVLVIHHPGHGDKTRERGSYSLRGAADARILISRSEDSELEARMEFLKMKDGPDPKPLIVYLKSVDLGLQDEGGNSVTSLVVDRIEETSSPRKRKNTQKDVALQILEELIHTRGSVRHSVSRNHPCVSEAQWRQACAERCLSSSKEGEAEERAYVRARTGLRRKQYIDIKNGYVWVKSINSQERRTKPGRAEDGLLPVHAGSTDGPPPVRGASVVRGGRETELPDGQEGLLNLKKPDIT